MISSGRMLLLLHHRCLYHKVRSACRLEGEGLASADSDDHMVQKALSLRNRQLESFNEGRNVHVDAACNPPCVSASLIHPNTTRTTVRPPGPRNAGHRRRTHGCIGAG